MGNRALKTIGRRLRRPLNERAAKKRLAEFHSEKRSVAEVASRAIKFGGNGFFKVQTQQKLSEITSLAEAVAAISPKTILEIGTWHGGTLLIWSSLASEMVVTCDLEDKTIQADFFRAMPPPGSACKVEVLQGDSHRPKFKEKVVGALGGHQVDFLFIDGDHSTEGARADFEEYSPLVRPGGLVAFHDIVELQPLETNQVFALWQELKGLYEAQEFIDEAGQCGYGIGLLRMPD